MLLLAEHEMVVMGGRGKMNNFHLICAMGYCIISLDSKFF